MLCSLIWYEQLSIFLHISFMPIKSFGCFAVYMHMLLEVVSNINKPTSVGACAYIHTCKTVIYVHLCSNMHIYLGFQWCECYITITQIWVLWVTNLFRIVNSTFIEQRCCPTLAYIIIYLFWHLFNDIMYLLLLLNGHL